MGRLPGATVTAIREDRHHGNVVTWPRVYLPRLVDGREPSILATKGEDGHAKEHM